MGDSGVDRPMSRSCDPGGVVPLAVTLRKLASAWGCHRCQARFLFEMCRWDDGGPSRSRQWVGLQVVLDRLACSAGGCA